MRPIFSLRLDGDGQFPAFCNLPDFRACALLSLEPWYRIGNPPVIYTDEAGKTAIRMLQLPFNLDFRIVEWKDDPKAWSMTKVRAFQAAISEFETFIHQDWDAFFLNGIPEFPSSGILTQSTDTAGYPEYAEWMKPIMTDDIEAVLPKTQICNFGVFGSLDSGSSHRLKLALDGWFPEKFQADDNWGQNTAAGLEQGVICCLLKREKLHVHKLLNDHRKISDAEKVGFVHLWGHWKLEHPEVMARVHAHAEARERRLAEKWDRGNIAIWLLEQPAK